MPKAKAKSAVGSHHTCAVVDCQNPSVYTHQVPTAEETKEKWMKFIYNENVPVAVPRHLYVCANHFTDSSYENMAMVQAGFATQRILKRGAVPTIRHITTCPPFRDLAGGQPTPGCFSNQGQYNAGLATILFLNNGAIPTVLNNVKDEGTGTNYPLLPRVRDAASQTDPPSRKSVATQLSITTLRNHVRSTATQVRMPSRDCGVGTLTFTLDSPLLLLQPMMVKRASKRPRQSSTDEEGGLPELSKTEVVIKSEDES